MPSSIQQALLASLDGKKDLLALPSEFLYQFKDVKTYNLDLPVIPAAITYPETPEQIAAIVKYASSASLKVQARSGGHSYANFGIGGVSGAIVIDMKNFQHFSMDENFFATFGAGTLLDDVTKRLVANGNRAIAHGICPQVGAGGHLTIGGFGPSSRMWGTALDHIVGAQVVLADGSIVRASETSHPDVFWSIKGAGASFGVVTEFTVRTHPAPGEMIGYSFAYEIGPFKSLAPAFKAWQKFVSDPKLSRMLYPQVTFFVGGMIISGTFFGSQADFDALHLESVFPGHTKMEILLLKDWLGLVTHWTEDIGLHLFGGTPCAFYSKCLAFKPSQLMSDKCIDDLMAYLDNADKGTLIWFLNFEIQGGATNDVPTDATAYAHRDVLMYMELFGIDIGRVTRTTRAFVTGVATTITSHYGPNEFFGSYPGYVDPELPDGQRAYWGPNLKRLERIKRQIDPKDVFHNPQSVRPTTGTLTGLMDKGARVFDRLGRSSA